MFSELPDIEIDELTGKPKYVNLQQNSLVYSPLNRKLLYTKDEVNAKITSEVSDASIVFNVKEYGAVGDGVTDDTVAIKATISSAVSGGIVFFPQGTYIVSEELLLTSGVTIQGTGFNSCVRRRTGNSSYLVNIFSIRSGENIRITGLQIDGEKQDIIDNHASIALDGSHIYVTCNGIYITGDSASRDSPSRSITIDNCYIHDAFYGNIEPDDVDGLTVVDNHIYHGRDNQINGRVNGYGGYCRNVTVSNNTVYGQGPIETANQFSGIQFLRGQYLTITSNTVYGVGNTFTDEGDGIGLEGCRHVTISGNTISYCLMEGIKVDQTVEGQPAYFNPTDTYIKNEYVYYNGNRFFALQDSQGQTPPLTATNNAYWQYQSDYSSPQFSLDVTISNNTVANCNYLGDYSVETPGIFYQYCDKIVIIGNTIFGNVRGISNGYNCGEATIDNNNINNNKRVGIALYNNATQRAIPVVRNNYVANSGQKGIDSVIPMIVEGNTLYKNGQAGISAQVTGTVIIDNPYILISDNKLIDNGDSGILINGGIPSDVTIEIRNNFAAPSNIQPRGLGENGSTVFCTNNRFINQVNESYYFTSTYSKWNDQVTFSDKVFFNGQDASGAIETQDMTLVPNPTRSTSASMFLDNKNGQVWEFFSNHGGDFGVYNASTSRQPLTIEANTPNDGMHINSTNLQLAVPLNMQSHDINNVNKTSTSNLRISTPNIPSSSSSSGSSGDISWDSSYVYICIATNTWKRVAISTW